MPPCRARLSRIRARNRSTVPARARDADHRDRELAATDQRLQRRIDLPVHEVTGGAEQHERVGTSVTHRHRWLRFLSSLRRTGIISTRSHPLGVVLWRENSNPMPCRGNVHCHPEVTHESPRSDDAGCVPCNAGSDHCDAAKVMARSTPVRCRSSRTTGCRRDHRSRYRAVRAVAAGKSPDTKVRDVMSREVLYCYEDQDLDAVIRNMGTVKVRRLPVLSRDKRLVGHHLAGRPRPASPRDDGGKGAARSVAAGWRALADRAH